MFSSHKFLLLTVLASADIDGRTDWGRSGGILRLHSCAYGSRPKVYLGHPNIVVTYTHHLGAARVTFGSTFFIFLHITLGCLENKKCYFDLTQEWKNSKRYKSFWIFSEFGFPCWKIKEQEFSKLLWSFFTPLFVIIIRRFPNWKVMWLKITTLSLKILFDLK